MFTSTIIPSRNEPRSNGNERVFHTGLDLQNWKLIIRYSFVSYPGHFLLVGGGLTLQQGMQLAYSMPHRQGNRNEGLERKG